MRQVRLALVAGVGVLVLCAIAVAASLADYVSHPAVAVAHVPPVIATPIDGQQQSALDLAPAPLPTTPVTDMPPPTSVPSRPVGSGQANTGALSRFLQQLQELQQRRHRPPR